MPPAVVDAAGAPMDYFLKGIRLVSVACGIFAAGLIAASVIIVCQMVIIRFVFNQNTIWQTCCSIAAT